MDGDPSTGNDDDQVDDSVDNSVDNLADDQAERDLAPFERPIDKFRRTATGSVVAAGLLGLRDAMEGRPEKEEVTIVSEAPTTPVGDVDIVIDPEHPERTVAIVRRPSPGDSST